MTELLRSFDPVVSSNATIIILGSMPGERSLAAVQYYAHPRNAFWRIMQEVVGIDAGAAYEERIRMLKGKGIALWDVLHSCHREGSLDSAIRRGSVRVNDFNAFFREHPLIDTVLFNGGTSERYYTRYVLPTLERAPTNHRLMPSTSPALAAISLDQKVQAWRLGLMRGIEQ
jgi:double-stranded uracil-DNA glycosylase